MPDDALPDGDQTSIVAALSDGSAVGAHRPLRRIDTHMSHLFLEDRRVFKLKRAIRHPFADMSALDARRAACEAELAVNARLAPGLYEGVLPVVQNPRGEIRVGGAGEAVDWVVVMRRFPDGALLSEMAKAKTLTPDVIEHAVAAVGAFHAAQPPTTLSGRTIDYQRILSGLRETEAQGAAAHGIAPPRHHLFATLDQSLERLSPLIESRREAGWVRRGHGDLHLRNICLFEGVVTPFDALEFDPALATGDVIYDIAFLLMDLRAQGLDALANRAMNAYWDLADQGEEALALLPFFMALRAAVRMAISVEAGDLAEAAHYRALGAELLKAPSPRLLAIGGLLGAGKSTLAQAVAPTLAGPCGARLLRTDSLPPEPSTESPAASVQDFSDRATVYRVLAQRARSALAAGSSVIADATFREDPARAAIEGAAGPHPFLGVWLRAEACQRVARAVHGRCDAPDSAAKVALEQVEPRGVGHGWRIVDAGRPAAELAKEVRNLLAPRPA